MELIKNFMPTKAIKITDNSEKLVDIKKYCPGVKIAIGEGRLKIEKAAYVRESLAKMLAKAQKHLPRGWNFTVRDAWRPKFEQVRIYYGFIERFARLNPKWNKKRVLEEVNKYVADWDGPEASGHMTGGAIDLRLIDKKGRRIPLRSKALTYQENAEPLCPKLPAHLKRNRDIFFNAMRQAGFTGCYNEFWHWSYGDWRWAKLNGKARTIYGVIDKNFYDREFCPCGSGQKFADCHGKMVG